MQKINLISVFMRSSFQEEAAYRANFFISLLTSLLNLATGILGVMVLFNQINDVNGWDFSSTLTLLGVYLTVSALRSLFISPSLDALAGMDGEIWTGKFDFTILKPVNTQFIASFRKWRMFALFDLLLGVGVLVIGIVRMGAALPLGQVILFLLMLSSGLVTLYSILLLFSALIFWSPGVLFTWVFDGFFQMARYPISIYPGWLRLILTWIIPVGVITTIPVQALTGTLSLGVCVSSLGIAFALFIISSICFRKGLRRYSSASS